MDTTTTQKQKLERVKAMLKTNGIPYKENHKDRKGRVLRLFVPLLRVVVHLGDDQEFYESVRNDYHPVFIREGDETPFVLEKVRNTILRLL